MTEKLNFVKIEAKGFQDLCLRIAELEAQNEKLETEVTNFISEIETIEEKLDLAERKLNAARINHRATILERNTLQEELDRVTSMGMFEFANEFCNDDELEEAGHQLARSLGVGMTSEEVAIETAENGYEPYTAEDF